MRVVIFVQSHRRKQRAYFVLSTVKPDPSVLAIVFLCDQYLNTKEDHCQVLVYVTDRMRLTCRTVIHGRQSDTAMTGPRKPDIVGDVCQSIIACGTGRATTAAASS